MALILARPVIAPGPGVQLTAVAALAAKPGETTRTGLRNLILQNVFDTCRGVYVPVADHFFVEGKLPDLSRTLVGIPASAEFIGGYRAAPYKWPVDPGRIREPRAFVLTTPPSRGRGRPISAS